VVCEGCVGEVWEVCWEGEGEGEGWGKGWRGEERDVWDKWCCWDGGDGWWCYWEGDDEGRALKEERSWAFDMGWKRYTESESGDRLGRLSCSLEVMDTGRTRDVVSGTDA